MKKDRLLDPDVHQTINKKRETTRHHLSSFGKKKKHYLQSKFVGKNVSDASTSNYQLRGNREERRTC